MFHWIAAVTLALNASANDGQAAKQLGEAAGRDFGSVVELLNGPDAPTYKWEVAEIDAAIPTHLLTEIEVRTWEHYLADLSPAQQIEKWAKALDEFHALAEKSRNPEALDAKAQVVYYSKWVASQAAAVAVMNRLQYLTKAIYDKRFDSDIEEGIFMLVDLLKSVHSSDAAAWEARAARHKRVSTKAFDEFLRTSPKPNWK